MAAGAYMKHQTIRKTPTAASVLDMKPSEVAPFVRKCLRERRLSDIVKDLNNDVVFGAPEQSNKARRALKHIGFI